MTHRNAAKAGVSHRHRQLAHKFGEVWPRGLSYASRQTNRQTDRRTDILITILLTPPTREVIRSMLLTIVN